MFMKVLVFNQNLHFKNQIGIVNLLDYLQIEYKLTNNKDDINDYDIIYGPSMVLPHEQYPTKKFIYGPHFSVFPEHQYLSINNPHKNVIYIQPSKWTANIWLNSNQQVPVIPFSFPVDTNTFNNNKQINERQKVFVYYKNRNPDDLHYICKFLEKCCIDFKVFSYHNRYNENDYISYLKESKYGIWIEAS